MAEIDILEERVAELENKMYGSLKQPSMDDPPPGNSVIENLLTANTMILSALSSREKANALVKRLPELNELLETSFNDGDPQSDVKCEILESMEAELRQNMGLMEKVKELTPALDVDDIKNVPELTPKLERLTVEYMKAYDESTSLNNNIHEFFSKYNVIIDIISKSLVQLDAAITNAEISAIPKKQLD